jgi:hypothetical protein
LSRLCVATPRMALSLRPTGLSPPAYRHQLDYVVIEDGQIIGRMYEDPHALADYRWFWSITEHIDPALGVVTNGRVPTLDEAKAQFKSSWSNVREASKQNKQRRLSYSYASWGE